MGQSVIKQRIITFFDQRIKNVNVWRFTESFHLRVVFEMFHATTPANVTDIRHQNKRLLIRCEAYRKIRV